MVTFRQTLAAHGLAENMLALVHPDRWRHTLGVTSKVRTIADTTGGVNHVEFDLGLPTNRFALIAAAFLHDIGYSSRIADTGFHPLDAARWLRAEGWPDTVTNLVANHSASVFEADERGLGDELRAEFPFEPTPASDALWLADLTVGPEGEHVTFPDRLVEIRERYGPTHIVTRAWARAEPAAGAAVKRAYTRLSYR